MKAIIQRVKSAQVTVHNQQIANINQGVMVLIGIQAGDPFWMPKHYQKNS